MIIKIFTGPLNYDLDKLYQKEEGEFIIGVDQACKLLIDNKIKIDLAVGDFDSSILSKEEVMTYAAETVMFDSIKNYTDTDLAIREALKRSHDEIVIYGGIGKRLDHTYANILLLSFGSYGNIKMINDDTEVSVLTKGIYNIENSYKYISFYALEDILDLTLKGFKYELNNHNLTTLSPLGTSNEGSGTVNFSVGKLLVIKTNE